MKTLLLCFIARGSFVSSRCLGGREFLRLMSDWWNPNLCLLRIYPEHCWVNTRLAEIYSFLLAAKWVLQPWDLKRSTVLILVSGLMCGGSALEKNVNGHSGRQNWRSRNDLPGWCLEVGRRWQLIWSFLFRFLLFIFFLIFYFLKGRITIPFLVIIIIIITMNVYCLFDICWLSTIGTFVDTLFLFIFCLCLCMTSLPMLGYWDV